MKNETAELWICTNAEYHADSANSVSHSELDQFIEHPELYFKTLITGELPRKASKVFDFGQVFHDLVLAPDHHVDRESFAHNTFGVWLPCSMGETKKPSEKFEEMESKASKSRYWIGETCVVRESDHWGTCGSCFWSLKGERERKEGMSLGVIDYVDLLYMGDTFVPIPGEVLSASGSKAGNAWKEFAEKHKGSVMLKESEIDPYSGMLNSIWEHDMARRILHGGVGKYENAIKWIDKETGLTLRCMIDCWLPELAADLKSAQSASSEAFARAAEKFGYHRQAAMYQDGIEALTGERIDFVFIPVEKDPPYRTECYKLDDDWIEAGREENRQALLRLCDQKEKGNFKSWSHGQVVDLKRPRFGNYAQEYRKGA